MEIAAFVFIRVFKYFHCCYQQNKYNKTNASEPELSFSACFVESSDNSKPSGRGMIMRASFIMCCHSKTVTQDLSFIVDKKLKSILLKMYCLLMQQYWLDVIYDCFVFVLDSSGTLFCVLNNRFRVNSLGLDNCWFRIPYGRLMRFTLVLYGSN